jgi:type IV pilus assembly protein PilN
MPPLAPAPLGGTGHDNGDWMPPLDLLRGRRRELNLPPMSGLLTLRPGLIRRGLIGGGGILAATLVFCTLLTLWHQLLKARLAELGRYEGDVEQLTKTLAGHQAALKQMRDSNDELVKRLIDVRSSSALLADLRRRVPEGVQLTSVEMVSPTQMKVQGRARDPVGFGRVNAMELVLRRSPLFQATGVSLGKVERVPESTYEIRVPTPGKPGGVPLKMEVPSAVNFEMTATLAPLAANQLLGVMEDLDADGMARRLRLLQKEGLLK